MTEQIGQNELWDPKLVDPFKIGGDVAPQPRRLRNPFSKPKLTESEHRDLKKIDSGNLTLEDIEMYAADHLKYFTSWGKARFEGSLKKEFEEAKMLAAWLDEEKYEQAIIYFLKKARAEWCGPEGNTGEDERPMQIVQGRDAASVPDEVIVQGETKTREFVAAIGNNLRLRLAGTSSAMYLKQAAVLARLL